MCLKEVYYDVNDIIEKVFDDNRDIFEEVYDDGHDEGVVPSRKFLPVLPSVA